MVPAPPYTAAELRRTWAPDFAVHRLADPAPEDAPASARSGA
ncbi:hypothetical protein [Nonomuraea sediminis]|nr:hypothetical protein [Nonomuraea sediminis]